MGHCEDCSSLIRNGRGISQTNEKNSISKGTLPHIVMILLKSIFTCGLIKSVKFCTQKESQKSPRLMIYHN